MHVHVVEHPLAAAALTRLRDERTARGGFRSALRELTRYLVYEATAQLPTTAIPVTTPMGPADGVAVDTERLPLLVPVLRAGLGMLEAALELLPEARTGFVGLRRDEETLVPDSYLDTVPDDLGRQPAMVLDPMVATAGSALHTTGLLRDAGAGSVTVVCALASPEGLERLRASATTEALVTAAIDEHLNDVGYIVPGLGDAGDRQYGLG